MAAMRVSRSMVVVLSRVSDMRSVFGETLETLTTENILDTLPCSRSLLDQDSSWYCHRGQDWVEKLVSLAPRLVSGLGWTSTEDGRCVSLVPVSNSTGGTMSSRFYVSTSLIDNAH